MALFTIVTALVLEFLGLAGFFLSSGASWTPLIPSIVGSLLLIAGLLLVMCPSWRRHALHGAAALTLLGFLGSGFRALPQVPNLLAGQPVSPSMTGVVIQLIFAAVCLLYFAVCFRSFLAARMARKKAESAAG